MLKPSASSDRKLLIKIVAAFAAIYVIWGTTYLGIRIAVETIPAFLMAGVRFLMAGTIAFVFLRLRGVPIPTRLQLRGAIVIGALLLVGGNGLVTWSEQKLPSGLAALVVATMPIWMTLLDWLVYRGTRPGKQVTAGLVLGFMGIGLLVGPGQILGTSNLDTFSLIVLFAAPLLWSLGSLQSKRANLPENVFMSTAVEMLAGGVLLLLAGLLTGEAGRLDIGAITIHSMLATLYLTLFGSIVALTSYVWLLKTVQPSKVSTYTYVNPVIAVFLGWFVLSEQISAMTIAAVAVIVLSVMLITTQKQTKRADQSESETPTPALLSQTAPCEAAAAGD